MKRPSGTCYTLEMWNLKVRGAIKRFPQSVLKEHESLDGIQNKQFLKLTTSKVPAKRYWENFDGCGYKI